MGELARRPRTGPISSGSNASWLVQWSRHPNRALRGSIGLKWSSQPESSYLGTRSSYAPCTDSSMATSSTVRPIRPFDCHVRKVQRSSMMKDLIDIQSRPLGIAHPLRAESIQITKGRIASRMSISLRLSPAASHIALLGDEGTAGSVVDGPSLTIA